MTIAISLVVGNGVVLGTDSATSVVLPGDRYQNIYQNAEKTINLVKGLPLGLMTYGLGSLGSLSIASLARALREQLSGEAAGGLVPVLDRSRYTVGEVATIVKRYFYDELYTTMYPPPAETYPRMAPADEEPPGDGADDPYPSLGFVVAGISAGAYYPEVWTVQIGPDGRCGEPELRVPPGAAGVIDCWGQPEAIYRLVYGWSKEAYARMLDSGLSAEAANKVLLSQAALAHPGMPIQDAIDLVQYLADITVGYMRFKPGMPTVTPPIDIAVITPFQGFKWVRRKLYYPAELNPGEPPHRHTLSPPARRI